MKTLYVNLRLIFSGDTVLLGFSVMIFLASVANATQWPVLQGFRFCGICTLLLSAAFCLLSGREVLKLERRKRTIGACLFFLAATLISLSTAHVTIEWGH